MLIPTAKLKELTLAKFNNNQKKTISLYETKKIRHYENDDFIGMMKEFNKLCEFIGITEPPSNEMWKMLADYLKNYHADVSKEEIIVGFNMAIAGRFNYEFKHFNRLTPQMFSEIIRAYSKFRGKIISEYHQESKFITDDYVRRVSYERRKEKVNSLKANNKHKPNP
jgi:hypothetical protein